MKRHESLVPISREHHQMLLLARLMRNDAPPYKGLPTEPEEKLQYAKRQFKNLIKSHFEEEQHLFEWVLEAKNPELKEWVAELNREHNELIDAFHNLDVDRLDQTGRKLEAHIRKEERGFFQALQKEMDLDRLEFKFR